jgi:hypothetical protein
MNRAMVCALNIKMQLAVPVSFKPDKVLTKKLGTIIEACLTSVA